MTNELIQSVIPAVEPVAEVVADTVPALDPQTVADAANAANFAGLVAGDPDATGRYIESLLRVIELVDDAGRLVEVLPLW